MLLLTRRNPLLRELTFLNSLVIAICFSFVAQLSIGRRWKELRWCLGRSRGLLLRFATCRIPASLAAGDKFCVTQEKTSWTRYWQSSQRTSLATKFAHLASNKSSETKLRISQSTSHSIMVRGSVVINSRPLPILRTSRSLCVSSCICKDGPHVLLHDRLELPSVPRVCMS